MVATATKPRGRSKKEEEPKLLDIPVKFGGVSFAQSASVAVIIDKAQLKPNQAENLLCGRRLDLKLKKARADEDPTQSHFDDMGAVALIEGSADANSYSSKPEVWTTRLYFNIKDINELEFLHLRKQAGRLLIRNVGAIPEGEKQTTIAEQADISEMELGELTIKALRDNGAITMGKVRGLITAGKLADVVGKGSVDAVCNEVAKFFGNPPDEDEDGDEDE